MAAVLADAVVRDGAVVAAPGGVDQLRAEVEGHKGHVHRGQRVLGQRCVGQRGHGVDEGLRHAPRPVGTV
jgi:hypothetical protein